MTTTVSTSKIFDCGARCAERYSQTIADSVEDIIQTLGDFSTLEYKTLASIAREWQRGYRTIDGNPDGRTADAARKAWSRLFHLAYGVKLSQAAPRSTSADATRKRADRAARAQTSTDAENATPQGDASESLTLSADEHALIVAIRTNKDYASILALLGKLTA